MHHLDATFDNSLGKGERIRHDYFNLSDTQILRDHEPVIWRTPVCEDSEHSYYREKKLSFTKYEDVRKRAAQAVKKGKEFLFHWRGGYLTKEVMKDLLIIFDEEAKKKSKNAYVSINWAQAVFLVVFRDEILEQQVEMEEANEGERYENE